MFFFRKRKIYILVFFIITFFVFGLWVFIAKDYKKIQIGSLEAKVELAVSEREKVKGMSNRSDFGNSQGLLFVYKQPSRPNFWMKEMNFALDIIWISKNQVVGFEKNLPPEGKNPKNIYQPEVAIDYALEVPAGFIEKNNIKLNDQFKIK